MNIINGIVGWVTTAWMQEVVFRMEQKSRSVFCFVTQQRNLKPVFVISSLLLATTPTHAAEGLGRLFTTPGQRVMLERLRSPVAKKVQEEPEQEEITEAPEVEEEPVVVMPRPDIPNITVNGLVKRSGGRSTAWVNGMNTTTGDMQSQYIEVNPRRIGKDHVHVEVEDEQIGDVSLKVGQSLDPEAAQITDSYQTLLGKPDRK